MKILFTLKHKNPNYFDKVKELGYEVHFIDERNFTLNDEAKDCDILVCYDPFNDLDLSSLPNLKWLQLSSVGIDQAPLQYLEKNSIILTHNKGGYSIPMGEWIVLKILEHLKKTKTLIENQNNHKWHMDFSLQELLGKTVGFIGTGTIAQEAAKRLVGFEANLIGLNTSGKETTYIKNCYPLKDKSKFLSMCDFVVLTLPATNSTKDFLSLKDFETMKDTSFLINISRGQNLNETDLIKALNSNMISGAALDVFVEEPLPESSPLWDMESVFISSHNSWISNQIFDRRFDLVYENLKRYASKEKLLHVIDFKKGY
ncbi:MAG: phosphoglycerate dehydrogenase [Tissierellales bacterium]|nr:phosphoglycerate dehydrogenase [Tissierellales bacterium]